MDTAVKWGVFFVPTDSGSTVVSRQVQLKRYARDLTLNRQGIWS
jgi:hypothetical protein